jgi:hypothetical protein
MSFFSRLFSKDTTHIDPDEHAHKPVPPCGIDNFYQHYYWITEGFVCPKCRGIDERKRELAEEDRKNKALAKAIADELEARGFK